jgi:hypothetical protein
MVWASSGLPRKGCTFLRGIPFEPPRAGMIAKTPLLALGSPVRIMLVPPEWV